MIDAYWVAEPCVDWSRVYMVAGAVLFYSSQFLYIIHFHQCLDFFGHWDILPKWIFDSVYKTFIEYVLSFGFFHRNINIAQVEKTQKKMEQKEPNIKEYDT